MRIILAFLLLTGICYADVKYEKTEDPNIVKKIETRETEISISELEKEIADLNEQIELMPSVKTITMPTDTSELERERNEKQSLRDMLITIIDK